jgi:type IV pilus assembly protein PilQ
MMNNTRHDLRSVCSTKITLTAAMLAMLAGAPVGLAQNSGDTPSKGLGSLMNLLGGGDQAASQPEEGGEFRTDGVYYDDNMTVELHVQDEDLVNVLQMLSLQSERNIVASNQVSARVTANLYGVTFYEALEAILHVNGFGYIEQGNFIYVYPGDEIDAILQASRQVEGHVFNLSFLNATDASDFVSPLLSDSGEIKSNGKIGGWADPENPTGNEEYASESVLIVYDFPENIEAVGRMLEELDTRPVQILVEATILQTSLNEANAFGVDFSIIADFDYADFVSPLSAVDALVGGGGAGSRIPADGGGSAGVSTPGNIGGPGTFKAGIVSNDVTVFIRMLQEVTSTTVISNPKVVTLNRQPGRVLVGRKVGYLQTTSTQTSSTQSVEFLDTGTQLNFRPFTNGDGIIRMELKPQVSEAQLRSATDATGAAITIPDEVTNELTANVMVPDGHTIVLGGLFREATTATRRQVPVLGDIPILGAAFRGHDDDVQRQEIIFMITPSIISDQVLVKQGLAAEEAARRVRAGAREGTLPFSHTRQAAQLLVEAEQLAADGKTGTALHKIRRALFLEPTNIQAIALREELVNEKDIWPTGSILDEIINGDAADAVENNILQHGWWGPTSEAENGTNPHDESSSEYASNQQANGHHQPESTSTQHHSGAVAGDEAPYPSNNQPYTNSSYAYGDAVPNTPRYDSSNWWSTPEFDMFMTTWAVGVATEQGEEFNPSNRWWNSEQFSEFFTAYQSAMDNGLNSSFSQYPGFQQFSDAGNGSSSTGSYATASDTENWWQSPEFEAFIRVWDIVAADEMAKATSASASEDWSQSPEFKQFLSVWSDAAQQESIASAEKPDLWWESSEFAQFMSTWAAAAAEEQGRYVEASKWWNSSEFREFMQAFESAVEKADAFDGSTSRDGYTEVPSDNED